MNSWNAFPFIRYSLALISGILICQVFPPLWEAWKMTGFLLFVLMLSVSQFFRTANLTLSRTMSGILSLLVIAYLGGIMAILNDDPKNEYHFTHFQDKIKAISGTIVSDHSMSDRYLRYEFEIQSAVIDAEVQKSGGVIFLYIKKDSAQQVLPYGTRLWVRSKIYKIDGPKNPQAFNYQQYLTRKNIYGQVFVSGTEIKVGGVHPPNPVLAFAYRVRSRANSLIEQVIPGDQEAAVLSALLIGIKDHLDNEIRSAYSEAGAMHVLAVSGLHVGIIYLLIVLVLGPLKKLKPGKLLFVTGALATIWAYALITGFSPSVMRAATMFSIIIFSENVGKKSNIYNSLGIAAFVLLLYNPNFIYDVGFQLSFAAVFGIVMLQPPLYRLWEPPNKALTYLWGITCVSIAAQLATFPISIHYFHQFPTYFLISNLVVIPAATVMLTSGLFMLFVASISTTAGEVIGFLVGGFIRAINKAIILIKDLPASAIGWLNMGMLEVILIYLFLIYLFAGTSAPNFKKISFSLSMLIVFFALRSTTEYQHGHQQQLVIYQVKDHLAIDLIDGRKATLLLDHLDSGQFENLKFQINPYRLSAGLPPLEQTTHLLDLYAMATGQEGLTFVNWKGKKIAVLAADSNLILKDSLQTDILIAQSTNWELISRIGYKWLVVAADPYYKRKVLLDSLKINGLKFHDLSEEGFFMIDGKNESGS